MSSVVVRAIAPDEVIVIDECVEVWGVNVLVNIGTKGVVRFVHSA